MPRSYLKEFVLLSKGVLSTIKESSSHSKTLSLRSYAQYIATYSNIRFPKGIYYNFGSGFSSEKPEEHMQDWQEYYVASVSSHHGFMMSWDSCPFSFEMACSVDFFAVRGLWTWLGRHSIIVQ